MKGQHVVGGGALVVALAAALWYLVLAPSRGMQVEPGGDAVVVTAAQAGAGTWVRYTITASNAGDIDFDGSLLLLNRGDQLSPDAQVARLPAPGQLQAAARGGRFPSIAPDAGYEVRLKLPARHQRVISLAAPERYTFAELTDRDGKVVTYSAIDAAPVTPVAVLSATDSVADAISQVAVGDFPVRTFGIQDPKTLPASATKLNGFAVIVIDEFDTSALTKPQVQALRDFVGLGGTVVVATGSDWRRTLSGLPPELTPLKPIMTLGADLGPVAEMGSLPGDYHAPIMVGKPADGARVIAGSAEVPLAVEKTYGAGQVVTLAFDPGADPVKSSRLAPLAWGQAISRGLPKAVGVAPGSVSVPALAPIPANLFSSPSDPPLPSPVIVGAVLLGYVCLVGPINLLLSRRLRKPDLLWVTTPLIAVLSTGGFYAAGGFVQGGNHDDEVQVLRAMPGGAAAIEYHRLLFHQRGQHVVTLPAGTLTAPLTLPLYLSTSDCPRCVQQLSGLPQDVVEHVINSVPPELVETGVTYGNVRLVGGITLGPSPDALEAHLNAAGGLISGTLRNLGGGSIRDISLYSEDGDTVHRTPLLAELGPGRTVEVQGKPVTVETRGSATLLLMNSLARASMAWDGRPLLIGAVDPTPSQVQVDGSKLATSARGFFEQQVRLESADSLIKDFEDLRLASHTGTQGSGYENIYDVYLPAKIGTQLQLSFDKGHEANVEIWDWAGGTWRPGPWTQDPLNVSLMDGALQPSEVQGGLLRIRAHEARTTWGAFFDIKQV